MKKIVVSFNSLHKIQKIKKIMKKVYTKNDDQIKDVAKFALKKLLVPELVERAEIQLADKHGTVETISIAKESMTFLLGSKPPFVMTDGFSEQEGEYIIVPWNINTLQGLENLKNLVSKISSKTRILKYTIYVNNAQHIANDEISIGDLSLSEMSFDGQMEELLDKIELLEHDLIRTEGIISDNGILLEQKQARIDNLASELGNLNSQITQKQNQINRYDNQISSLNNQLSGKNSEVNNLRSQVSQQSSNISNLNYQVSNLNKTPRVTINAGGMTMSGSRASGSLGIDNVQVNYNFNSRTLNVLKQGSATITHQIVI